MPYIAVRHNMEVAHRLYLLEGKCEQIHGHSMWADLKIYGGLNENGVLEGLSFGNVKKTFRNFLDTTFDHHLLLNEDDPWAKPLGLNAYLSYPQIANDAMVVRPIERLPGLMTFPGDPTTENLAKWIAEWAHDEFKLPVEVLVHETGVNAAGTGAGW